MAIPSFDELLSQARQIAQSEEAQRTGTLLAKGLSEGFTKAFLTPPVETKRYEGYLTQEGQFVRKPFKTSSSLIERGFNKLFDREEPQPPKDAISLTAEEASKFGVEDILARRKSEAELKRGIELEKLKQSGRESLLNLKLNAQKESVGQKIIASSQQLGRATSDYIYGKIGVEPSGRPILTYGEADRILREKTIDVNEFFKEIGVEIQLGKDILGSVSPESAERIRNKLSERGKSKILPASQGQKIRVIRKSDGVSGSVNLEDFDPTLYERE